MTTATINRPATTRRTNDAADGMGGNGPNRPAKRRSPGLPTKSRTKPAASSTRKGATSANRPALLSIVVLTMVEDAVAELLPTFGQRPDELVVPADYYPSLDLASRRARLRSTRLEFSGLWQADRANISRTIASSLRTFEDAMGYERARTPEEFRERIAAIWTSVAISMIEHDPLRC